MIKGFELEQEQEMCLIKFLIVEAFIRTDMSGK